MGCLAVAKHLNDYSTFIKTKPCDWNGYTLMLNRSILKHIVAIVLAPCSIAKPKRLL